MSVFRRSEFHSHTVLTDGEVVGIEMIRHAVVKGLRAITITDHVSFGNIDWIVQAEIAECELARDWEITAIPGVEITHVPPQRLDEAVSRARRAGAQIVVVHGETLAEPVAPGTNRAAVSNPEVDILAHPGFLTAEEADLAKQNDVFLELSGRRTHMVANGHVARVGERARATLIVDSDAHEPKELLTQEQAIGVARGAGLGPELVDEAAGRAQETLLKRLGFAP
ncbi:MAG: histidinol phosphate phosphatase domain-containing protein [Thermoplasmata archaeon]|nr:histidinol phosphate phosphatase domain-containing protein [Thermoplasmata archaeon]MCI4359346.1 histidinol phosphate phosphatase domain-containing protein [Thermoplasmata archaeon]